MADLAAAGGAATSAEQQEGRPIFKLLVPGHGNANRSAMLLASVRHTARSLSREFAFVCHIFVYTSLALATPHGCLITRGPGLWTDFMKQEQLSGSSDYVALMMDDVAPQNVDFRSFMRTMQQHRLDLASAAVPDWHWPVMRPHADCLLRRSVYVDMLFAVFTRKAYDCFQRHMNLSINHGGWGYDATFHLLCAMPMGILDQHFVCHTTGEERSYDDRTARDDLWRWLRYALAAKISSDDEGLRVVSQITDAPTACVPMPDHRQASAPAVTPPCCGATCSRYPRMALHPRRWVEVSGTDHPRRRTNVSVVQHHLRHRANASLPYRLRYRANASLPHARKYRVNASREGTASHRQ